MGPPVTLCPGSMKRRRTLVSQLEEPPVTLPFISTLKHYREKGLTFHLLILLNHFFLLLASVSTVCDFLGEFIKKKTFHCFMDGFWRNLQSMHVSQSLHICSILSVLVRTC